MAPRGARREEVAEGGSIQQRLLAKMASDKNIKGGVKVGDDEELLSVIPYYISTQAPNVDYIIGRPGVPAGRLSTFIGPEGSGKSTFAQHTLVETQHRGGIGILVDSEQRFNADRFAAMGGNPKDLIIIEGLSLEKSFDAVEKTAIYLRDTEKLPATVPITIIYDSVAGSPTEKALEADVGERGQIGVASFFLSRELPRIKQEVAAKRGCALVLVNQLRTHFDTNSDPRTRNNERRKVMRNHRMIGEWTIIYESSLILYFNTVSYLGEDPAKPTGIRSRVTVRKSGIAPRENFKTEVDIDFKKGIDKMSARFELLESLGLVKANGGYYSFSEELRAALGGGPEKSWYRKDFGEILLDYPKIDDILAASSTWWSEG